MVSGEIDTARLTGRFHASGKVDGVAPDIKSELTNAHHARDDWATVKAQTDLPIHTLLGAGEAIDDGAHFEGRENGIDGMRRAQIWKAPGEHVCIANGFELFESIAANDFVKSGEVFVQGIDQGFSRELFARQGEADKIAEADCGVFKGGWLYGAIGAQLRGDGARQNV